MEPEIKEQKNVNRRVTNNFVRLRNFDSSEYNAFKSWKTEMTNKKVPVAYDHRNNIYCVGPTMDFEMYYNYLQYLNESYNEWLSYGYFDMGMVPYLMWPSFMNGSEALELMRDVALKAGVTLISVPSISFLKPSYISNGTDYWIFREDLFKIMKFMEEKSPMYRFGVSNPDEATLSNFLKPLAQLSRSLRGGQS